MSVKTAEPTGHIIPHKFLNASEQPGQYAAELSGRQAVTALFLYEHPDLTGYIFRSKDTFGDPWLTIDGVDALRDGSKIILEYGRTGEIEVKPDFQVFVSRRALEAQGFELPPTGEEHQAAQREASSRNIEIFSAAMKTLRDLEAAIGEQGYKPPQPYGKAAEFWLEGLLKTHAPNTNAVTGFLLCALAQLLHERDQTKQESV